MSEHKLTVSALYRPGWSEAPVQLRAVPLLQLSGRWLEEEVGLYPGCAVRVQAEEGRLVVVVRGYEGAFGMEG
jgi:hypothetical protein